MTLLPIVQREFVRATRRKWTFCIRPAAGGAATLFGIWKLSAVSTWQSGAGVGRDLFDVLSVIAFTLCLGAGVFATAVAFIQEKNEGTLGLLFLTDLKGYDVVMGKLAITSLNTARTLLGIIPILSVPIVLGGVSLHEFWRMIAVLFSTLVFSLGSGLLISSISRKAGRAMLGTTVFIIAIVFGLAAVDHLISEQPKFFGSDFWLLPGPMQAFFLVSDLRFSVAPNDFWLACGFTFWSGVTVLAVASLVLPYACRDRVYLFDLDSLRERWARWVTTGTSDLKQARRRILARNPIFWLASRRRWKWFRVWGALLTLLGVWIFSWRKFAPGNEAINFLLFVLIVPTLHTVLKIWIAAEACNRFAESSRTGELEVLLVSPVSVRKICRGHLMSIRRQFVWPVVAVASIDVTLIVTGEKFFNSALAERTPLLGLIVWGLLVMLIVDLQTLAWVGLWQGIYSKSSVVALRRTVTQIMVLPSVIFALTLGISPTFYLYGKVMESQFGWVLGAVIWWWIIAFGVNTVYLLRARREVAENFRGFAAMRAT